MEVSVSEEALIMVKGALNRFKVDMSGSAAKIWRMAEERLSSADSSMYKIHQEVEIAEATVNQLEKELVWLMDKIHDLENERALLEHEIEELQYRIDQIKAQISALESQIASCSGQNDEKAAARISELRSQISSLRAELEALDSQLLAKKERLKGVHAEIEEFTVRKNICEKELEVQRVELARLKNKENCMKEAYGQMKRDLEDYVMAAKQFESAAVDMVHGNRNALDQCIYYVEQYLSQNL